MPISGIDVLGDRIYVRVKYRNQYDKQTQNNYNRFKNSIREKYGISTKGFGGHGNIYGNGFDVHSFKTPDYFHILIICNKKLKSWFIQQLELHFGYMEFDAHKNTQKTNIR
jgi:hypothetical protein